MTDYHAFIKTISKKMFFFNKAIAGLKYVFKFAASIRTGYVLIYLKNRENLNIGSIAQLVQSTCLTSRGSQVRTLLLPQK
jgi:hypothetical protein